MAGIRLEVTVDDREVREAFRRLAARVSNLTPVLKTIGQTIRTSVVANFESGGRPPWTPTRPISLLIRERMKGTRGKKGRAESRTGPTLGGHKTLIDTGRLMTSIAAQASATDVAVGTNVVYGAIHQLGGKAGRGRKVTIPARPYLAVQPEDWSEIGALLVHHLKD